MHFRLTAAVALLWSSVASAQGSGTVNYQGRLLKADGSPEVGVVAIDFAFCPAAAGVCGSPQTIQVALADGFYSVELAAGGVDMAGDSYLSIKLGGNELLPRQHVTGRGPSHTGRNLINWIPSVGQWTLVTGVAPAISLSTTDALEGGSSFEIASNVASPGAGLTYGDFIPVDPNRRYRGRISAELVAGGGVFFAGYVAFDAAKKQLVGNGGSLGYFIATNEPLTLNNWKHFQGFISGEGTGVNTFPTGTRFIKPLVLTNYFVPGTGTGTTRVSSFEIYEESYASDYDSGWVYVASGTTNTVSFAHNLGAHPTDFKLFNCGAVSATGVCTSRVVLVGSSHVNGDCGMGCINPYSITTDLNTIYVDIIGGRNVWGWFNAVGGWVCTGDADGNCSTGYYRILARR